MGETDSGTWPEKLTWAVQQEACKMDGHSHRAYHFSVYSPNVISHACKLTVRTRNSMEEQTLSLSRRHVHTSPILHPFRGFLRLWRPEEWLTDKEHLL